MKNLFKIFILIILTLALIKAHILPTNHDTAHLLAPRSQFQKTNLTWFMREIAAGRKRAKAALLTAPPQTQDTLTPMVKEGETYLLKGLELYLKWIEAEPLKPHKEVTAFGEKSHRETAQFTREAKRFVGNAVTDVAASFLDPLGIVTGKSGLRRAVEHTVRSFSMFQKTASHTKNMAQNAAQLAEATATAVQEGISDVFSTLQMMESNSPLIKKAFEDQTLRKQLIQFALRARQRFTYLNVTASRLADNAQQEKMQRAIESFGPVIGKFVQLALVEQEILDALSPDLREIVKNLYTRQTPSRSRDQAQTEVDQGFGLNRYIISNPEPVRVGVMTEYWLARDTTQHNKPVTIKLIKEGITQESLNADLQLILNMIRVIVDDPFSQNYFSRLANTFYQYWLEELDLEKNYIRQSALAKQTSQEIRIVSPIASSKKALIMEKVNGVPLNQLEEMMIALNQEGKKVYVQKFRSTIDRYPWLEDLDQFQHKIPELYLKMQIEQLTPQGSWFPENLPLSKLFIDFDNNRPHLNIDPGLTIAFSREETSKNILTALNMMIGNGRAIAQHLVEQGGEAIENKQKTIRSIEKKLNERIYQQDFDLSENLPYIIQTIAQILQEEKIALTQIIDMKASYQFFNNYDRLCAITGETPQPVFSILVKVIKKMVQFDFSAIMKRQKLLSWKLLTTIFSYFVKNPQQATRAILNFILTPSDSKDSAQEEKNTNLLPLLNHLRKKIPSPFKLFRKPIRNTSQPILASA